MNWFAELLFETFEVKENPFMSFIFLPAEKKLPEKYFGYKLFKTRKFGDRNWNLFVKKETSGCLNSNYWRTDI